MSEPGEYKVLGELDEEQGAGVYGHNTATSGQAVGVQGATDSPEGHGLYTDDNAHVGGALESASKSPNVVVYEEDGTAYAVSEDETHTGSDIFDAAQQAIDYRLSQSRPMARGSAGTGDIHLRIRPGYYEVATGLSITTAGVERIVVEAPGTDGAYVDTSGVEGSEAIVSLDQGEVPIGNWRDRFHWVTLSGLVLDNRASNGRDTDGLVITDTNRLILRHAKFMGFRRGLYIENVWQGIVDNIWVNGCGVGETAMPAIQLGRPEDTDTHQETNHIVLRHLQGDPGNGGFDGAPYLQTYGRLSRMDIEYPNVELPDDGPGFMLTNGTLGTAYNVRGATISGGAPTFAVSQNHYQFSGGYADAGTGSAIEALEGVPKLSVASMALSSSEDDVVDLSNTRLAMAGCKLRGGTRGLRLNNMSSFAVSGTYVRDTDRAGIKIVNGNYSANRGYVVSGVALSNVAGSGEHPVVVDNSDAVQIGPINVVADDGAPDAAVSVTGSDDVAVDNVHAVNQPTLLTHSDSSFADTTPQP